MNNRPVRFLALAPFAALAFALPAAAQTTPNQVMPGQTMPGQAAPGQAALNQTDRSFIHDAGAGGLAEVDFGKLADQKSQNDSVKHFAQQMIQDHTKANDQLAALAKADGIAVPDTLDPDHRATRARLEKLDGARFDRAYIAGQISDHQKTIALFQQETAAGQDPQLKGFAAETLPTIRGHLKMAQGLETELTPQAAAPGAATEQSGSSMPRASSRAPRDGAAALNREELRDLGPAQGQ
jgi:putative membrane protein